MTGPNLPVLNTLTPNNPSYWSQDQTEWILAKQRRSLDNGSYWGAVLALPLLCPCAHVDQFSSDKDTKLADGEKEVQCEERQVVSLKSQEASVLDTSSLLQPQMIQQPQLATPQFHELMILVNSSG